MSPYSIMFELASNKIQATSLNFSGLLDLLKAQPNPQSMLRYAIIFFVIALVAGLLGAGGVAGLSMEIAYVLGIIGLVLLVISFFTGRSRV